MFEQLPERPKMLNERSKRSPLLTVLSALGSVLLGILLILMLLFAVFNFWVNRNCFVVEVSGTSMMDTVQHGDLLYVMNVKPERGDIIIISVKDYAEDEDIHFSGEYIIKRLIATEGDTVICEDGVVKVMYAGSDQFVELDEPYIRNQTPEFEVGPVVTVGEGEIFFLGDNRNNSYDSTEIGCLKVSDIVGVVPEWALKIKSFSTFWEKLRSSLSFVSKD